MHRKDFFVSRIYKLEGPINVLGIIEDALINSDCIYYWEEKSDQK